MGLTPNFGFITTDTGGADSEEKRVVTLNNHFSSNAGSNVMKYDEILGQHKSSILDLQNKKPIPTVNAVFASTVSNVDYFTATVSDITELSNEMIILLSLSQDNSGAVTLDINSLGSKFVKKIVDGESVNLDAGDLKENIGYLFQYNGVEFDFVGDTLGVKNNLDILADEINQAINDISQTPSLISSAISAHNTDTDAHADEFEDINDQLANKANVDRTLTYKGEGGAFFGTRELNEWKQIGLYSTDGDAASYINRPPNGSWWMIEVIAQGTASANNPLLRQVATGHNNANNRWERQSSNSGWTSWARKADLESPAFTGTPTAPTAAAATNNTQIATTQFVHSAVSGKSNKIYSTMISADAVASNPTTSFGAIYYAILTPNYSQLNGKTILLSSIIHVYADLLDGNYSKVTLGGVTQNGGLIEKISVLATDYRTCRAVIQVLYTD